MRAPLPSRLRAPRLYRRAHTRRPGRLRLHHSLGSIDIAACGRCARRGTLAKMTTALFTHLACLYHETPPGHPESSDRLRAVLHALDADDFKPLDRHEARSATEEEIARVHPGFYISAVMRAVPERGFGSLDPDTHVSPGSG